MGGIQSEVSKGDFVTQSTIQLWAFVILEYVTEPEFGNLFTPNFGLCFLSEVLLGSVWIGR